MTKEYDQCPFRQAFQYCLFGHQVKFKKIKCEYKKDKTNNCPFLQNYLKDVELCPKTIKIDLEASNGF